MKYYRYDGSLIDGSVDKKFQPKAHFSSYVKINRVVVVAFTYITKYNVGESNCFSNLEPDLSSY